MDSLLWKTRNHIWLFPACSRKMIALECARYRAARTLFSDLTIVNENWKTSAGLNLRPVLRIKETTCRPVWVRQLPGDNYSLPLYAAFQGGKVFLAGFSFFSPKAQSACISV